MFSNSSTVVSRPWVLMLNWKPDLRHQRRGPDPADGGLHVLGVDRIDDVLRGNPEARHAVQGQPDAHRIGELAEQIRLADAGYPLQRVQHVDLGVIRQEQRVAGSLRRIDRDDLQQCG
jgi:hypothetical protein